jgi:hypothetical protein
VYLENCPVHIAETHDDRINVRKLALVFFRYFIKAGPLPAVACAFPEHRGAIYTANMLVTVRPAVPLR